MDLVEVLYKYSGLVRITIPPFVAKFEISRLVLFTSSTRFSRTRDSPVPKTISFYSSNRRRELEVRIKFNSFPPGKLSLSTEVLYRLIDSEV